MDNPDFMNVVIHQLRETSHRFREHVWSRSMYIIINHNGVGVQPFNDSGIFDPGETVNILLVRFWCTWDDAHGFGIFHSWRSEQNTFVVVSSSYVTCMFLTIFFLG